MSDRSKKAADSAEVRAADDTAQVQRGRPFRSGQSGNPSGRPKGSRNKLGEVFREDLLASWEAHGPAAIEAVIKDKPEQYLKVVASLMPRDLNVNANSLHELTDEQLIDRIRALTDAIRPFLDIERTDDAASGAGPKKAH